MTGNATSTYLWFMRAGMRNRARSFLAQVRSPRYAIAVLFGAGYFFFLFVFPLFIREPGHTASPGGGIMQLARGAGALALALLAASWWLWRTDSRSISLTPAEANLLVPAPITRRQLIQFKLLTSQPGLVLSALLVTGLSHSSALPFWARFIAFWVLFATLQMHRYGASLVHTSLSESGSTALRRVWPAALIFAVMLGSVLWSIAATMRAAPVGGFTMQMVFTSLASRPASIALIPFHAALGAVNAIDLASWTPAFAVASGIALLHYIWVIRMDAAFEETAAAAGVKRAALVEAAKAGRAARFRAQPKEGEAVRAPWFTLSPAGNPAVAILWKNVLGVTRGISRKMLAGAVPVVIFLMIFFFNRDRAGRGGFGVFGFMALGYGAMVSLMGPLRIRHDFRFDLQKIELLRTLPVGGTDLAAAEIMTSSIVVSLLQLILVGAGVGLLIYGGILKHTHYVALAAGPALLLLFAINATMVTVHNVVAVIYPAWKSKPGGIEMFGVAIITMILGLVVLALSLIGPSIVALVAVVGMGAQWGRHAYIPAAAGLVAGTYMQLALLVVWLGRVYDRMDPVERIIS
jgi:hypothetical protein